LLISLGAGILLARYLSFFQFFGGTFKRNCP
jgi:hypothetical protein